MPRIAHLLSGPAKLRICAAIAALLIPGFITQTVATTTQGVSRNVNIDGFVTIGAAAGSNTTAWETDEVFPGWSGTAVPEGVTSWYLSWDDDFLYLGKTSFSEPDNSNDIPSILYLKAEYPADGGYSMDSPVTYDNVDMDFDKMGGINFLFYFKNGYDEYRRYDNGWQAQSTALNPIFQDDQPDPNGGTQQMDHMEIAIPWDVITNNNGKPDNLRAAMIEINPNNGNCLNSGNIFGESPWGDGITDGPTLGTNDGGVADASQPGGCPGTAQYPVQPTIERWWGCYPVIGGVSSNGWVAEVPEAGIDRHLCETDTIIMDGNDPSGDAVGTWTWSGVKPAGAPDPVIDDINDPQTTIRNILGYGEYEFEWSINYGNCPAPPDTITVTRYLEPAVADAGADDTLSCSITNTTMTGNDPGSDPYGGGVGTWTVQSGTANFDDENDWLTDVSGLSPGANVLRWTIESYSDSCEGTFDEVMIYVPAQPSVFTDTVDSIAIGTVYPLIAPDPTDGAGQDDAWGYWSILSGLPGASIADSNAFSTTVAGMDTGRYVIQWRAGNRDCPEVTATVTLDVFAAPIADISTQDTTLCGPDQPIVIRANSPITTVQSTAYGYWTQSEGPTLDMSGQNAYTLTFDSLDAGSYTFDWNVGNYEHSEVSASIDVLVHPDISLTTDAGPDQQQCGLSDVQLAANAPVSPSTGAWTIITSPGGSPALNDNDQPDAVLGSLTATGRYELEWTVAFDQCPTYSDTMEIEVYSLPSAEAGNNQDLACGITSTQMTATDPGADAYAGGQGYWAVISGAGDFSDINDPVATVTNLASGANVFEWVVKGNEVSCDSSTAQVTITTIDAPGDIADAGQDVVQCGVADVALTAVAPISGASGMWSVISTPAGPAPLIDDATQSDITVSQFNAIGAYELLWSVTYETCDPVTDTVVITINAGATADAGTDQSLGCAVDSTFMTAFDPGSDPSTGGNGYWNIISGTGTFEDETDAATKVTGLAWGDNIFEWVMVPISGTCDSSTSTVTITTYESVDGQADAGPDQETESMIGSLSGAQGTWTSSWIQIDGAAVVIDDALSATTAVTYPDSGTYVFEYIISNGPCTDRDTVQVTVERVPIFVTDYEVNPDPPIGCLPLDITVTVNNADSIVGCQWDFGDGTVEVRDQCGQATHRYEEVGEYQIILHVWALNGAEDIDTIDITVEPAIEIAFDYEVVGNVEDIEATFMADMSDNVDDYYWVFDGLIKNGNPITENVDYASSSTVTLFASNEFCEVSVTEEIDWPEMVPLIPNVFTPNGDGTNDDALVELPGIIENYTGRLQIQIFDRWGIMMQDLTVAEPTELKWDGRNKFGALAPEGTYYAIVYIGHAQYTGVITLMLDGN